MGIQYYMRKCSKENPRMLFKGINVQKKTLGCCLTHETSTQGHTDRACCNLLVQDAEEERLQSCGRFRSCGGPPSCCGRVLTEIEAHLLK